MYHISLTNFLYESRVLKEVSTVSSLSLFDRIYILALHDEGLRKVERIGVDVILVRVPLSFKNYRIINRIKFLIYLELFIRIFSLINRSKFSVVSLHVIDLLPIGMVLKILKGCKLIYDAHELEPYTSSSKVRIAFLNLIERIFVRYVDTIIVVNNSILEIYRHKFPSKPIYAVYNAPYLQYPSNHQTLRTVLGISFEKKIFLYQGGLSEGRGIESLLKAFSNNKVSNIVLVFLGYGELASEIKSFAKLNENIFLLDAVAPERLLDYTASCDFGISLIENTCLSYYYCLPNKALEYLMCRKPILVSNLFELRKLVDDHNIGVVSEGFGIDDILSAINSLLQIDYETMQQNIEKIIASYSWDAQEVKIEHAYRNLLNLA